MTAKDAVVVKEMTGKMKRDEGTNRHSEKKKEA